MDDRVSHVSNGMLESHGHKCSDRWPESKQLPGQGGASGGVPDGKVDKPIRQEPSDQGLIP